MSSVRSLQEDQIRTWNEHDEASWVNLFTPEATFSAPGGVHGSGTEITKTFYHIWQDAFPDNQLKTLQIIDGADAVVLEERGSPALRSTSIRRSLSPSSGWPRHPQCRQAEVAIPDHRPLRHRDTQQHREQV